MKNKEVIKSDITFIEACKLLKKSKRTLTRYIKNGLLNPDKIKTEKGILKYRFSQSEVENLKKRGRGQATGQNIKTDRNINDTLVLLKSLNRQLRVKDDQIKSLSNKIDELIERQRETNILTGQLQNKVFLLEDKSKDKRPDKNDRTGDKIRKFISRILF